MADVPDPEGIGDEMTAALGGEHMVFDDLKVAAGRDRRPQLRDGLGVLR